MKAFIHPSVQGEARKNLEALLAEEDCEVVDDLDDLEDAEDSEEECEGGDGVDVAAEGGTDEEDEDPVTDAPACIVVLTPDLDKDELEPDLTKAVGRGCRVIGIWGPGAHGDASVLDDYGADTVPWDRARIWAAVCGVPQHKAPDGGEMKLPKTKHGGC